MNDDDIQNSVRLIKLYKHLPQEHRAMVDADIVTSLKAVQYTIGDEACYGIFLNNMGAEYNFKKIYEKQIKFLQDEELFAFFNKIGEYNIEGMILYTIAEHMKLYLSTRQELIEENIHWIV